MGYFLRKPTLGGVVCSAVRIQYLVREAFSLPSASLCSMGSLV
jgi:hypothetical protein